jgi:hypothetical protein
MNYQTIYVSDMVKARAYIEDTIDGDYENYKVSQTKFSFILKNLAGEIVLIVAMGIKPRGRIAS